MYSRITLSFKPQRMPEETFFSLSLKPSLWMFIRLAPGLCSLWEGLVTKYTILFLTNRSSWVNLPQSFNQTLCNYVIQAKPNSWQSFFWFWNGQFYFYKPFTQSKIEKVTCLHVTIYVKYLNIRMYVYLCVLISKNLWIKLTNSNLPFTFEIIRDEWKNGL